jgi:hypothetical protein
MAVRQTGFALLASASVQEAHDLALAAQAATLATRAPFVHFFDGFRTSHELNTIEMLNDGDLHALVPAGLVRAHRERALSPDRPFIRGTAQNPDAYFQARETVNPFYARVPAAVQEAMDALGERTGRRYRLMEYHGHPQAERVIVLMGSGGRPPPALPGTWPPAARRWGSSRSACTGRSRRRRCSPRCRPAPGEWRCSTAPRSRDRWASRCSWTCSRPWRRRTRRAGARSCRP